MSAQFRGGSGEPLVLVHGFANSWRAWEPVLPALCDHHEVLAPTLPGHLCAERLPAGTSATVSAMADGVERAMDAAGFGSAHVCGNSLGGWIGLELARRGRARSLVCLAPAGGWEGGSPAEKRLRRMFTIGAKLDAVLAPHAQRLVTRPGLRKLLFGQAVAHPERLTPAQAAARIHASAGCQVYRELMDSFLRESPPSWLDEVGTPTLIAWPEHDQILPMDRYSAALRAVKNAEWTTLAGVGHVPMADDPGLIAKTVADWVGRG